MQITSRDINLFRWINSFGFVFTEHVAAWMGVRYQTAHARIWKLRQAGLISTEKKTSGLPHLLFLTNKSWYLTGDSLPLTKHYNRLHTLNHNVRLIELSLLLQSLYPDSRFVSERWILHNGGQNNKNHIPDGQLWLKGKKYPIAIELELSQKKRSRLQKIIRNYKATLTYDAVWYFTAPALTNTLLAAVSDDPLFHIQEVTYTPCL